MRNNWQPKFKFTTLYKSKKKIVFHSEAQHSYFCHRTCGPPLKKCKTETRYIMSLKWTLAYSYQFNSCISEALMEMNFQVTRSKGCHCLPDILLSSPQVARPWKHRRGEINVYQQKLGADHLIYLNEPLNELSNGFLQPYEMLPEFQKHGHWRQLFHPCVNEKCPIKGRVPFR